MANIASILRKWEYCDIVLDSPFGKVVFDYVDDDDWMIYCHLENDKGQYTVVQFDFLGRPAGSEGECVLFPEGKTDWNEGEFSIFHEGDLLMVKCDKDEFVIEYAGVDKDRFVKASASWCKNLGFGSGDIVLCHLDRGSDVRPASSAECTLLRLYMEGFGK